MAYDKAQLQKIDSALEQRFSEFYSKRQHYDAQVRRQTYVDLPSEITGSLDPVQYDTATLEKDIYDHVEILRMNPTRIDLVCKDDAPEAKKSERRVLLYLAGGWAQANAGRWWDAAVGEGQVRHGVKVTWNRWRKSKKGKFPFYLSNTNLYGCKWTRVDGLIDLFIYKFKVPILEAGVKNAEGKRVTLDTMGNLGWLGPHQAHDTEAIHDKSIEVIVCDYRSLDGEECPVEDCDHPMRYISIYVGKDGGKIEEAEEAETFPSPFAKCSFKVTGARVSYHETNPHQEFRPLMLPAYDMQEKVNYHLTLLATKTRQGMGDEDVYGYVADPSKVMMEGGISLTVDRPAPGSNQLPVYSFELKRWPKDIDPHEMKLIEDLQAQSAEFRPNRFMTGTAFTEASNATGTAYLAGMQQAGLPYNGLLGSSDATIKEILEDWLHALRYWAVADPEGQSTEYTMAMTGEESVRRYGRTLRTGEVVTIDPKRDLKYDIEVVLKTESRTQAEQRESWALAYEQYEKGFQPPEYVAKEIGIFDIEEWEDSLLAAHIRQTMQPVEDIFMQRYFIRRASNKTGMDFAQFVPQPPGEENTGGGMPPQGKFTQPATPGPAMERSRAGVQASVDGAHPSLNGGSQPGY